MSIEFMLPLGILMGLLTWTLFMRWYIHPYIKNGHYDRVLELILLIHTFRYIGLMFLVPGVTSGVLDTRFSHPAAYGDLIAAMLAFISILALRLNMNGAQFTVWIFNVWGMVDLLNAVGRGLLYTEDGHLGATYWIPAMAVPPLLVTHGYVFLLLVKHGSCRKKIS